MREGAHQLLRQEQPFVIRSSTRVTRQLKSDQPQFSIHKPPSSANNNNKARSLNVRRFIKVLTFICRTNYQTFTCILFISLELQLYSSKTLIREHVSIVIFDNGGQLSDVCSFFEVTCERYTDFFA